MLRYPGELGYALDRVVGRVETAQHHERPGRGRLFRAARVDQREGYHVGKFARVRCARRTSTTTPVLYGPRPPPRATGPSESTAAALPAVRRRRRRRVCVGATPLTPCAGDAVVSRRPNPRRPAHVGRPEGDARRAGSPAPAARARHDSPGQRLLPHRNPRRAGRPRLHRRGTTGFDAVRRAVRPTGRTGQSAPRRRVAALTATVHALPAPATAMISRRAPSSTPTHRHRAGWINLAWRSVCPVAARAAAGHRHGQGNGRAGASTARRRTSSPATASSPTRATARTSQRCGGSTRGAPGPGVSAYEMLDRLGTTAAFEAAAGRVEPVGVGPNADQSRSGSPRLDLLSSRLPFLFPIGRLADVVLPPRSSPRRGHHDQPRGRCCARPPRAGPPPGVVPSCGLAALAERLGRGAYFPTDPSGPMRAPPASAGGIADYAGISWTPRRRRGAVLACPTRRTPARAAVPDRSDPRRRARSSP